MNDNPSYNNPQQNWNQPPIRKPQPRKRSPWVLIIILISAIAVGGLFYFVASLGKNVSETIGKFSHTSIERMNAVDENSVAKAYTDLADIINANSKLPDSLKSSFTKKLSNMKTLADEAQQLIKKYDSGLDDSINSQGSFSPRDKTMAHCYLIKTGRATNLKNALTKLKTKAFADLPQEVQDSSILDNLHVYANESGDDYKDNQFSNWETLHFNQTSSIVRMNFTKFEKEIQSFEKAIIRKYRDYILEMY
ncbi:MAG: hypothetical protein ABIQ40_11060 [Bacteroidia bacterium]